MKHFLLALLCALAIAAAQGRTLAGGNSSRVAPAPPVPAPSSNRTFSKSMEAANIPANVTFMTGMLDAAFDNDLYDITTISTILVPVDTAWVSLLEAEGLNGTALKELNTEQRLLFQGAGLAAVLYHEIPDVTLTTANLTDGLSLPTSLEGAGNITVHVDPVTHNITFVGFVNKTDAAANTTNSATVLFPNIPVVGSNGVVMHVIDSVLQPPQEAFEETTLGLAALMALGEISQAGTAAGSPQAAAKKAGAGRAP